MTRLSCSRGCLRPLRGPGRAARTPGPPGQAALLPQGPRLPGRHRGPGAGRGHVPRGELWRREHRERHLGREEEERCRGVVSTARSDRPHALPGPLGAPHWCCSHHGPRDRPQPRPQPRPRRLLRGGSGGAGRLRDGRSYPVPAPGRGRGCRTGFAGPGPSSAAFLWAKRLSLSFFFCEMGMMIIVPALRVVYEAEV